MIASCGRNAVLIVEGSQYTTAYCGPKGVLIVEVSLYRTVYCVPSGIIIVEGSYRVLKPHSKHQNQNNKKPKHSGSNYCIRQQLIAQKM
jgi:hypothetical protein